MNHRDHQYRMEIMHKRKTSEPFFSHNNKNDKEPVIPHSVLQPGASKPKEAQTRPAALDNELIAMRKPLVYASLSFATENAPDGQRPQQDGMALLHGRPRKVRKSTSAEPIGSKQTSQSPWLENFSDSCHTRHVANIVVCQMLPKYQWTKHEQ